MRSLVKGSTGRRISWSLVAALLLPLLMLAMPSRTARAQLTRLPQVGVLDFGVLPTVKASGILGRNATDAVVVEMTRTGRFDVTPRTQLNQQLQDLGLTAPLDNIGIQKLGGALSADFIATGDVTSISFTENPRRARVTLAVRLTDVVTGELANGAIETGFSPPPPAGFQPDDETLINQAISNAAFNAVKTLNNYTLPTATIIGTRGSNEVILNRGGRDGITNNLNMVVFRGSERVGKVKITYVGSTDSTAVVTDPGKGIRPEDRVRAIFELPGYNVSPDGTASMAPVKDIESYRPNQKKKKSIVGVVLGVAAAVLLASLLFSKKSHTNTAGLSSLRARAYADVSVLDGGNDSAARVQINWSPAPDIPSQNILEYQILRDGVIIGRESPDQTFFTDRPDLNNSFTYLRVQRQDTVPTPNDPSTGSTTTAGTTTTTGTTGSNNNTGSTSTSGSNPANPNSVATIGPVTATPLIVGQSHTYQVRIIYVSIRVPDQTGTTGGGGGGIGGGSTGGGNIGGSTTGGNTSGNNSGVFYDETSLGSVSGIATPIARPLILAPTVGQDVNPAAVRVTFRTTRGANQYVAEFSTDPQFAKKYQTNPEYVPYSAGADSVLPRSGSINLSSQISQIAQNNNNGQSTTIFFRVGARNLNDNPGPMSGGFAAVPNGGDYVYSGEPQSFNTVQTPPTPPQ